MSLPFRPISQFYLSRFGAKVYKIPVSIADDCPNRRGLRGMKTCSFCDIWGSAARSEAFTLDFDEQVKRFRDIIQRKFKAKQFLVYFQAFTTTFSKLQLLKNAMEKSYNYEDVVGFVIGTRPDCLSSAVLSLWREHHQRKFVSVELGVQSFNDHQLLFLQRGHTAQDSFKAIDRIHREAGVDLGIHIILGLPGDTLESVRQTALVCNSLPISNIKLHNLHVLKNTQLEQWHREGKFAPVEFQEYAEQVRVFLENLDPRIYIHRLAAYAPRWDELIAPQWTADKMKTHQGIVDHLNFHRSHQGKLLTAQTFNPSLSV